MSHSGGPEVGRWEQETWGLLDPTPGRFLLPLRRAQISSTPVSVSIASCNPPSRRGEAFKPLGRLQLQIRTLTERLYQLGTGEEESFGHVPEGVPSPGGPNQNDCYENPFASGPPGGVKRAETRGAPTGKPRRSFPARARIDTPSKCCSRG